MQKELVSGKLPTWKKVPLVYLLDFEPVVSPLNLNSNVEQSTTVSNSNFFKVAGFTRTSEDTELSSLLL